MADLRTLQKRVRLARKRLAKANRLAKEQRENVRYLRGKAPLSAGRKRLETRNRRVREARRSLSTIQKSVAYERTLRKFKPRRSDRGRIVFVTSDGIHGNRRSTKKGTWVKVSRAGKVRPYKLRPRSRELYRPGRISLVSRARTAAERKAAVAAEGRATPDIAMMREQRGSIVRPRNAFKEAGARIRKAVKDSVRSKRVPKLLRLELAVTIRAGKRVRTITTITGFDIDQLWAIKRGKDYFVQAMVWRSIRGILESEGYITQGSARVLSKRDEETDLRKVAVEKIEWRLMMVQPGKE